MRSCIIMYLSILSNTDIPNDIIGIIGIVVAVVLGISGITATKKIVTKKKSKSKIGKNSNNNTVIQNIDINKEK